MSKRFFRCFKYLILIFGIFTECIFFSDNLLAQSFLQFPGCSHKYQSQHLSAKKTSNPNFDVLHYDIRLDISDLSTQTISGFTIVTIKSEINGLQEVELNLLALTVDSVLSANTSISFSQVEPNLFITLPLPLALGATAELTIYYGGQPVTDASGWGGFYFSGNYAFNLGVGFAADPHNFGRAWFPCVDNFTDRATYDFHITTSSAHKAFCNGLLQNTTTHPNNTITWHWKLSQSIPTYLASVAVGPYVAVEKTYQSISGNPVPVTLAAQPSDTVNFKNSFVHLPDAFEAFEACFGEHPFERIGFTLVPFNSGAMEHATNIAYPRYAANGFLQYESLMAHEFSHHWWGDLVTCETAEDMWLNEGWARYSEKIFFEKVYGSERYAKEVRKNHKDVLQFTHIKDDSYRAVSGVSHAYTYSSTVYDKGGDMAHTLRGYMGDDLFFQCLKSYLTAFSFRHANSHDFRDHLSQCSGINLTAFFDNWIFQPGFPHFSIDSLQTLPNGNGFDVNVFIRQRLKAAPELYREVPLEITFFSENFDSVTQTAFFSGSCGIFHTELNFEPVFAAIDIHEKISDAITDKYHRITSSSSYDFEEALMTLNVIQLPATALVRVEHHWIAPVPMKTKIPGLHLSKERYWKVDGLLPDGFNATAIIKFDGSTSMSTGFLDNELITNSEDSLVILFRENAGKEWTLHPSFAVNTQGSTTNKRGEIFINNITRGEYALGIRDSGRLLDETEVETVPCYYLSVNENIKENEGMTFSIFPNPAKDSFFIQFEKPLINSLQIRIFDISGKLIQETKVEKGSIKSEIRTSGWVRNTYLVQVNDGKGTIVKKVVTVD